MSVKSGGRRRIAPLGMLSLIAALPALAQEGTGGATTPSSDLPPPLLLETPEHPATSGGGRWGRYGTTIAEQIQAALRANKKTRDAVVKVEAQLWLDDVGHVTRVELVSSSGNSGIDAAVRNEILAALVLKEPPPKDMPMPVVVHVTPQQ